MSTRYPFDPALRARVADLLFERLPALYRIRDLADGAREPLKLEAAPGTEPLFRFLHVLAAPLAVVRQSVEELHADLFIDTCADWVLPYLAQMIGSTLVFPDAPTNRRDVRATMAWRRRKGTPGVLQDLGSELSGQMVVTHEGWKRIAMTQDTRLLRLDRTVPDLRPASVAEQGTGPLDALFHAVDPRLPSREAGRYHPRHVTHWTHPTLCFPLRDGIAAPWVAPDPAVHPPPYVDRRYAFHPLGRRVGLRVRQADPSDRLATDRVPPMHFAASPITYFDQEGTSNARFTVRITGLVAAVAEPATVARTASVLPAEAELAEREATLTLLAHGQEQWTGAVDLELLAVPLVDGGGGIADTPAPAGARVRGGLRLETTGGTALPSSNASLAGPWVAMLRLTPVGTTTAYFPGATVELAGSALGARLGASDSALAARGFLRGALVVEVPGSWVRGARWFYVAADGSVLEAQSPAARAAGNPPDLKLDQGPLGVTLPGTAVRVGPGPAWPPRPGTASAVPWRGIPLAPAAGPVVLHGGHALRRSGNALVPVPATGKLRLALAAKSRNTTRRFLGLAWNGPDPTTATTFTVFDAGGNAASDGPSLRAALADLAQWVDLQGPSLELCVRFEADDEGTLLPPCELALTSDDGDTVLVHLPTLETTMAPDAAWPSELDFVSDVFTVADDGSTHPLGSLSVARLAYGNIAPLREAATLRRRIVRQRSLCPWDNETPGSLHAATPTGCLDIDPAHGLFALANADAIPTCSTSIEGMPVPASVTVDYQEGYSMHVGARPAPRAPVLGRTPQAPTRLVMGRGRFHAEASSSFHGLPRYATLTAALADIALHPAADGKEVVQIEDSATYAEAPTWPASITNLTIQAAEGERPVLVLSADWKPAPAATYEQLELRGLAVSQDQKAIELPAARYAQILLCTALDPTGVWRLQGDERGRPELELVRCITPRIELGGRGKLVLTDSVVDAADGRAIAATGGTVELSRVTVLTRHEDLPPDGVGTMVQVLEASECIFTGRVVALDRFEGCIRYSRVEAGSVLPRRHRVIGDSDEPEQAARERPRFVTRDQADPAHARLAERCDRAITRGAEDGSEMGAFHDARLGQRMEGVTRRLVEHTPAGLVTGVPRLD